MNTASSCVRIVSLVAAVGAVVFWLRGADHRTQAFQKQAVSQEPAAQTEGQPSNERPFGIATRVKWTTSRIVGSPDPPPPYRAQRVFPKLHFQHPTLITSAPGTDRFFVAEQDGKVFSFPNDPQCDAADLLIDLKKEFENLTPGDKAKGVGAVYGLAFHPRFQTNRYCYVCYTLNPKDDKEQLPEGTRVSRFEVSRDDPPRCDPASERVILTWLGGGHNGGCLKFGPDGYLYISTGDGGFAFPPDGRASGQDTSNLLSSILRIDVDHPPEGSTYAIPKDNPLVGIQGSRGEIWAYGLRNPWKISFDRQTGDLWVGDVGWELWELVYRVVPGGNYGWSIMEGPQLVHVERKRGPGPILPPTVQIPHTDGASITGGFVYRGKKLPELVGTYIFGDWETRRVWGVKTGGEFIRSRFKVGERRDLVEPTVRLVAFGEDHEGELYLLDYDDGTIHTLAPNDAGTAASHKFPRKLSETGLFTSTAGAPSAAWSVPAPGVIPFSVNVPQWADYATAERFIALPGDSSVVVHASAVGVAGSMFSRSLDFPVGSVLAKTISLETERGGHRAQLGPSSRRRLETQILHFDGTVWRGYSYQWNDEQTDATLVESAGAERELTITDPQAHGLRPVGLNGRSVRRQTWQFPGRAQCTRCHNPWAEHTLAFNLRQLDKDHDYGQVTDNQLRTLQHIGILAAADGPADSSQNRDPNKPLRSSAPFTNPHDPAADVNQRARSYLHVNCAHCHRFNGGGVSYISLEKDKARKDMGALGVRPTQGTFDIPGAQVIAAGEPFRSVLYYRLATEGRGRMPHIGSSVVDEGGLRLIYEWIRRLPKGRRPQGAPPNRTREPERVEKLKSLDKPLPNDSPQAKEREQVIAELLASTSGALALARALKENQLSSSLRDEVVQVATQQDAVGSPPNADRLVAPPVRELFEQFLPDDKRARRLGSRVQPDAILALGGDADRGRGLFFNAAGVACKNCHRAGESGSRLGPDLSQIGKQYTRRELLESILEPSKKIDPKYATWLVETTDGRVLTGLLVERTADRVVLRNAQDQLANLPADQIEQLLPQRRSIMPELLVRDLTAEQLADLLAFLASLK